MADIVKETKYVENGDSPRRSSSGIITAIIVIVIVLLALLFLSRSFGKGGTATSNSSSSSSGTPAVNVSGNASGSTNY